jgi:hypothetical protein
MASLGASGAPIPVPAFPPPPPGELEWLVGEIGDLSARIRSQVLRMRTRGIRMLGIIALYLGFGQPLLFGGWFGNPYVLSPLFLAIAIPVGVLGLLSVTSPSWWITWQLKRRDRFLAWWRKLPSRAEAPPSNLTEALQELEWSRVELEELRSTRAAWILFIAVGIAGLAALSAVAAWELFTRAYAPALLPALPIPFFVVGICALGVGVVLANRWLSLPPGLEARMRGLEGRIAWMQQQFWTRF